MDTTQNNEIKSEKYLQVLPTRGELARRSFQGLQRCEQRPPSCSCEDNLTSHFVNKLTSECFEFQCFPFFPHFLFTQEAIAAENEAIAHGDASAANLLVVPAGGSVAGAAPVAVAPAPAPVAVAPAAPVAVAAPVAPAAVAAGNVYTAAAPVATYAPGVTYNTPYAGYAGAVYPGYAANGAYAAAPAAAYAAAPAAAYATHAVPAATYAAHY